METDAPSLISDQERLIDDSQLEVALYAELAHTAKTISSVIS